jgi:hypothetical protein
MKYFLASVSVRGSMNRRIMVQLEGLGKIENIQ